MITPENRFSDICGNLKSKITHKEYLIDDKQSYRYRERFYNDKEILMDYNSKNGDLWVKYSSIWSVFQTEYDMTYQQIQGFIKTQMGEVFKSKELTPSRISNAPNFSMGEVFKSKELTPYDVFIIHTPTMGEVFKSKELTPAMEGPVLIYPAVMEEALKPKDLTLCTKIN